MTSGPTVSVVLIFFNERGFLAEAIESVLSQTYRDWELLLVDDGSTDESTSIARSFAERHPDRIRYLEHPGHANRGMSATRNLGFAKARGRLIAPLDGDDVWVPEKLEQQVALLDSYPEAGMLFGKSRYWFSWTGAPADAGRDFVPDSGVPFNTVLQPPEVLRSFLGGQAAVPCPSDILVKRARLLEVGGFEESFPGIYEDQAFYAKFCVDTPVVAIDRSWHLYRQHSDASTAQSREADRDVITRRYFLEWLQGYIEMRGLADAGLARTVAEQTWLLDAPVGLPARLQKYWRWARKWLLRSGLASPT